VEQGAGLFAEALMRRFPGLPVEDEGRLTQPDVREAFVRRVFEWHNRKASGHTR
jgi:hypothetical protein